MMDYVYSHYPLARYRGGVYMAVANEEEQAAAEAEGWTDWHSDQARLAGEVKPQEATVESVAQEIKDESPAASDVMTDEAPARKKPGRKPKVK